MATVLLWLVQISLLSFAMSKTFQDQVILFVGTIPWYSNTESSLALVDP